MTAIETIQQCVDKSKSAGVAVPRCELEQVVALAQVGEAWIKADFCLCDAGFACDGECPYNEVCDRFNEYDNLITGGVGYDQV